MASFFLFLVSPRHSPKQIFFFFLYNHCWTLFTVTLPLFETHMKNYRLSLCLSGCRPQWLHVYASISMDRGAQKTKQNNHDNMNAKTSRSVWRPDGGTQRNRKERFNRQEKTWDQVRLGRLLILATGFKSKWFLWFLQSFSSSTGSFSTSSAFFTWIILYIDTEAVRKSHSLVIHQQDPLNVGCLQM